VKPDRPGDSSLGAEAELRREAIRQVLAGRDDAFESIVKRHERLVASVAWRLGAPREDIDDLTSEVFLKIYRNLRDYEPRLPFASWLYRIAVNHVLDHQRRRRADRARDELSDTLAAPGAEAPDVLQARRRVDRLRLALAEVPEKYRVPVFLLHVEERSIEEISGILGLPAGTVKTRLHRGRARLEAIIRDRYPDLVPEAR
jgi:RNA polymerase sigma-70 factor (ECF subfamily)